MLAAELSATMFSVKLFGVVPKTKNASSGYFVLYCAAVSISVATGYSGYFSLAFLIF